MSCRKEKMEERAVVIDSLLCFVSNFRHDHNLESLIVEYFAGPVQEFSQNLLLDLLADIEEFPDLSSPSADSLPADEPSINSSRTKTILALFDRIIATKQAPIFVAADLTTLPITLLHNNSTSNSNQCDNISNDEVLDEIRQMRHFLQAALQPKASSIGNKRKCRQSCYSPVRRKAIKISPSSPEFPTSHQQKSKSPSFSSQPLSPNTLPIESPQHNSPETTSSTDSMKNEGNPIKTKGLALAQVVRKLWKTDGDSKKPESGEKFANEEFLPMPISATEESNNNTPLTAGIKKDPRRIPSMEQFSNKNSDDKTMMAFVSGHLPSPVHLLSGNVFLPIPALTSNVSGTPTSTPFMNPLTCMQMLKVLVQGCNNNHVNNSLLNATEKHAMAETPHEQPQQKMEQMEIVDSSIKIEPNGTDYPGEFLQDEDDDIDCSDEKRSSRCTSSAPSEGSLKDLAPGEKPFYCSQESCNKRFKNKFLLKKHEFIHTGLKPHICLFCTKRFNRKDNLLRHNKTHLANAINSDGTRRRHNMLDGVSEEVAALKGIYVNASPEGKSSRTKSGVREKREAASTE